MVEAWKNLEKKGTCRMKSVIKKAEHHIWSFIGSFTGIALIGLINMHFGYFDQVDNLFLIGSFGATAVLIYGEIQSPLAQPRNVILGNLVSAVIGVTIAKLFKVPHLMWLGAAFSVSISTIMMQIIKAVHPPGGATALIAAIGSEKIKAMGYMYVFSPILTGVSVLMIVAFLLKKISKSRRYPFTL